MYKLPKTPEKLDKLLEKLGLKIEPWQKTNLLAMANDTTFVVGKMGRQRMFNAWIDLKLDELNKKG